MFKLYTRKNEKVKLGFPYNSEVDSIIAALDDQTIAQLHLTADDIDTINKFKDTIRELDRSIFDYLEQVSEIQLSINSEILTINKQYTDLMIKIGPLVTEIIELKTNIDSSQSEIDFLKNTITALNEDITKINTLIVDLEKKLVVSNGLEYSENYINETKDSINSLSILIESLINDITFYKNTLHSILDDYRTIYDPIKDITYEATSLKILYDAWKKDNTDYSQILLEYFKSEYEQYWTYGKSILYDERMRSVEAKLRIADEIYAKMLENNNRLYNYKIEIDLKNYSLEWLSKNEYFDNYKFNYMLSEKKIELINSYLVELETEITRLEQSMGLFFSKEEYDNYLKFQEYVMAKRKYIYLNINSMDENLLANFDKRIEEYRSDYNKVFNNINSVSYKELEYLVDLFKNTKISLLREKEIVEYTLSKDFEYSTANNEEIYTQIDFYKNELVSINTKLESVIEHKNQYEDSINILENTLKLKELDVKSSQDTMKQLNIKFEDYIDKLIPVYFGTDESFVDIMIVNNIDNVTMTTTLLDTLENLNYDSIKGFNLELLEELFDFYKEVILRIYKERDNFVNGIFEMSVFESSLFRIKESIFIEHAKKIFGLINFYYLNQDSSNYDEIIEELDNNKVIFIEYSTLAIRMHKDILILKDLTDYNEIVTIPTNNISSIDDVIDVYNSIFVFIKNNIYLEKLTREKRNIDTLRQTEINKTWDTI